MQLEPSSVDEIVTASHKLYSSLLFNPQKGKFTILASCTLASRSKLKVVSLGAGSKCLPATRLSPRGDALHDSHAEVIARRGFVRWLLEEVARDAADHGTSEWIENDSGMYRLRDGVELVFYVSTVPCGDASTRLLALGQDPAMASLKDATSWPELAAHVPSRGRDNYSRLGALRTKPGRADAPSVLSLSCSDKIARWNVLGMQGALASKLMRPTYISAIIIGDVAEDLRDVVREDCDRAFYGRICSVQGLPEGYEVTAPSIFFTSVPFVHSRTTSGCSSSSNDALCWISNATHGHTSSDVLINGLRRGVPPKHRYREKFWPSVSKVAMFNVYRSTLEIIGGNVDSVRTYFEAKGQSMQYQAAKQALFRPGAPFSGWIRSGVPWEAFNIHGISTIPSLKMAGDMQGTSIPVPAVECP